MLKLNIKTLKNLDKNYLFILIFTIFIFLYFNPYRVFYWSADQDLLFIKYSLGLLHQKIDYDHTGIFAFIFNYLAFKLLSVINFIDYDSLITFVSNLNELKLQKSILIIRFTNIFILILILFLLYKIFKIIGLARSTSLYLVIFFSLSKSFLSYHFEVRTDLFSILLIVLSILLILKNSYLYLITFTLSLAYVNKTNFFPILFFFPIFVFIYNKNKLKTFSVGFVDKFLSLIFFIIFLYFILLFRISVDGKTSLNTELPIFIFSTFYQLFFVLYFLFLYYFFNKKFVPLNIFVNFIFGCLLTVFIFTFFLEKNIITLLYSPYEHLVRYSSSELDKKDIFMNLLFNKNLNFYKSFIKDNLFIFIFIFIYFSLKIKSKITLFNKYDFLIIFSFFFLNFQLLRGHYLRYEIYSSIFLVIYIAYALKESLYKKKTVNLFLILSIIFMSPFIYNIKNNNISYSPFVPQTFNEICGMGRDWIKGDFGGFLIRYCN